MEGGRILIATHTCKLRPKRVEDRAQIAAEHCRLTQILNGVAAFGDCSSSLIDGAFKFLSSFGYIRTIGHPVNCALEEEHNSLKTLQQGVVQFPRNPRPLVLSFIHAYTELVCHL